MAIDIDILEMLVRFWMNLYSNHLSNIASYVMNAMIKSDKLKS